MAKITSHKGQLGVEVSDAVHDQNYKSQQQLLLLCLLCVRSIIQIVSHAIPLRGKKGGKWQPIDFL